MCSGIDIEGLPAHRVVNVIYALFARFVASGAGQVLAKADEILAQPPRPMRETWGDRSSYRPEVRATMSAYGPPPGWNPPRGGEQP